RRLPDLSVGRCDVSERPIFLHLPNSNGPFRLVAKMLRRHAMLADEEGRPDEALQDARAALSVARAGAEPPMMFTALLAISARIDATKIIERALAQGEPTVAAMVAAQRDAQEAIDAPLFLDALRGERAVYEDFVRAIDYGRV